MSLDTEYHVPNGALEAQDRSISIYGRKEAALPPIAGTGDQSAKQRALIQKEADDLDRMNREARARLLNEPLDFVMPTGIHDNVMYRGPELEPEPEREIASLEDLSDLPPAVIAELSPAAKSGKASHMPSEALIALIAWDERPYGFASALEQVAGISHHQAFSLLKGKPVWLTNEDEQRITQAIASGAVDAERIRRRSESKSGKTKTVRATRALVKPAEAAVTALQPGMPLPADYDRFQEQLDRIESMLEVLGDALMAFMEGAK